MIFEKELLSLNILDVLTLRQSNANIYNAGRTFDALSFRFHADTCLTTAEDAYHLTDNTVCFVPAGLNYRRSTAQDDLIVIHLNASDYVDKKIEVFTPENPERFGELFREILECWNRRAPGYKYRATALLYEIFGECHAQNRQAEPPQPSRIRNSVDYIAAHFRESDLSIRKIADRSFMSEVYFRKLFKEEFGISPQKYLIRLRIQNAVGLISAGYYSLKEIAYLSGYNDYKYFSVEFKKIMGVSPSEYPYRSNG